MGGRHGTMEAESKVTRLQTKGRRGPPAAGGAGKRRWKLFPREPSERAWPGRLGCERPGFGAVKEYISTVLSHPGNERSSSDGGSQGSHLWAFVPCTVPPC